MRGTFFFSWNQNSLNSWSGWVKYWYTRSSSTARSLYEFPTPQPRPQGFSLKKWEKPWGRGWPPPPPDQRLLMHCLEYRWLLRVKLRRRYFPLIELQTCDLDYGDGPHSNLQFSQVFQTRKHVCWEYNYLIVVKVSEDEISRRFLWFNF